MNGLVTAPFGGEVRSFRLTIGGAEELEERCDAGLPMIARRLIGGEWRLRDVRETIRLGLVGAGMEDTAAMVLIERYASQGLESLRILAVTILGPMLTGVPDDPPGKSRRTRGKRRAASAATAEPASVPITDAGP